jgi:hypothetical protein
MILDDGNIGGNTAKNIFVINSGNIIIWNASENVIGYVIGIVTRDVPRNIVGNIETGPSNIIMHQTITLSWYVCMTT